MRRSLTAAAAAILLAGSAQAEAVAPADVVYDEGAVAESLTGAPGNAEAGALVIGDKAVGNCVSCHQVSALADVPFQGNIGPSLDGAGSRWTEPELRGIVSNAKMTFDGSMMPSFYKVSGFIRPGIAFTSKPLPPEDVTPLLTAEQIEDVVAFLMTLQDN